MIRPGLQHFLIERGSLVELAAPQERERAVEERVLGR
jgi:hypothetical protein